MRTVGKMAFVSCAVVLGVALVSPQGGFADDETDDTSVAIEAPITAVSCDTTPATVTVLGLNIDISKAVFGSGDDGQDDGVASNSGSGGGSDDGEDDDGDDDSTGGTNQSCATLQVGNTVGIGLTSDGALAAATVSSGGGDVKVQGAIQAIDTTAQTIQVLGLVISTANAQVDGADDDDADGNSAAIDSTLLALGQIVEVRLDASQLPSLVATSLEVKNFTNQVEVEIDDANGDPIEDSSDDISVDVDATTTVQGTGTAHKKVVHLHANTNGSIVVSGLPTGRAKITVKRGRGKKSARVVVNANSVAPIKVKLKH